MAKLNSSELKILDQIAGWKGSPPGFLNRATAFVSKPVAWVFDSFVPDNVKGSMGGITDSIIEKLQDISQWTVNKDDVLKATKEFEIDSDTIVALKKASIHDLDHVAEKFRTENTRLATASGFGTGIVGWPGLIADLPALFMISLRSIYQISLCYGYDPNASSATDDPQAATHHNVYELSYMLRVFKLATASNKIEKQKALSDLKDFELGGDDLVSSYVSGDYASKSLSKNVVRILSQHIINEIVQQTITRKAFGLIPGLGAIFNAGFNYAYMQDVGDTAYMIYRERFLLDKKGRKRVININID